MFAFGVNADTRDPAAKIEKSVTAITVCRSALSYILNIEVLLPMEAEMHKHSIFERLIFVIDTYASRRMQEVYRDIVLVKSAFAADR